MIGDDDVGSFQFSPVLPVKTFCIIAALASLAVSVFALDRLPGFCGWHNIQFVQRTVCGFFGPFDNTSQLARGLVKQRCFVSDCIVQPPFAQIMAAAFGQPGRKPFGQNISQKGNVFFNQLLLKINRVRADENLAALLNGLIDCSGQISKTFTYSRSRLHRQMKTLPHRRLHPPSHRKLLGTGLKVWPLIGNQTLRPQQGIGIQSVLSRE